MTVVNWIATMSVMCAPLGLAFLAGAGEGWQRYLALAIAIGLQTAVMVVLAHAVTSE